MEKVVVFGGTGFVGSFICKELAKAGWEVVSISKSGRNKYLFDKDCERIRFVKANVLAAGNWAEELADSFAVVNCIGILIQNKQENITYKRLIFETTCLIAQAAEKAGVKNFIHISAIKPPLFVLHEYNRCKQEAEKFLQSTSFNLLIIRPRIIVSRQKPFLFLLYKLQELVHFPRKLFEPIEVIAKSVENFLQAKRTE